MNDIFYWLEGLDDLSYNKVKDYITNLQQENEYLKKTNDEKTKIGIADHKYASQMEDKVIMLQQENYELNRMCELYGKSLYYAELKDYKSRVEKAIEYNYELQERYCHSAIFDELVASKVYEITEKELNILQNGSEENNTNNIDNVYKAFGLKD